LIHDKCQLQLKFLLIPDTYQDQLLYLRWLFRSSAYH